MCCHVRWPKVSIEICTVVLTKGAFFGRIQKRNCDPRSYGFFTNKKMTNPKKDYLPWPNETSMHCERHDHCQMYFFWIPPSPFPKKNAQIMNLKNPDLDFDLKNPLEVWILCIHGPFLDFSYKTQNPFLDSRIRIWIFRQKCTLRPS